MNRATAFALALTVPVWVFAQRSETGNPTDPNSPTQNAPENRPGESPTGNTGDRSSTMEQQQGQEMNQPGYEQGTSGNEEKGGMRHRKGAKGGEKQGAMLRNEDIKWDDAPNSLPAGAKMGVLQGDPMKSGQFTMRLKLPAGYKIQPNYHPVQVAMTVIDGSIRYGKGDSFNEPAAQELTQGGFALIPAREHHFISSDNGATVQLTAMGPWAITYVNPADDPRGHKAQK